ncbi:MAG: ABC transporter substrate-binding protein [Planctomycetes bacterium]|nr:ABC transporter substrate-binding protein [Planctomycetota bacterium]
MRRIAILLALLAFVSAGCEPAKKPPAPTPSEPGKTAKVEPGKAEPAKTEPIRIGAIFAVTGPAAWLGKPEQDTVLMLAEEINAAGGINGRKIEVIVEDTQGLEEKTVAAVNKLIDRDEVVAIVGPSRSGTTMAVKNIAEELKVPLVSCAAAEAIVDPVAKYVFKTPQKDSDAAIRILETMKEMGIDKIAILTSTEGFGAEGRKQLQKLAPDHGIEIVADETYDPKATDLTAQLTVIKGTEAKAVVNWSIVPAQSIVAKNMKQLDMGAVTLFQSHGFGNVKYLEASGEAGEGTIFPCGRLLVADALPDDHPQKKLLMAYKAKYEEKYKEPVSTFGGHAYDAFMLVVDALKKVGPDRDKIRDAIESTTGFVGTGGIFNYSAEDHTGLGKDAFEMITIRDGKFVPLQGS